MRYFGQVKCAIFLICVGLTLTSCQDVTQQNNTKIVGLKDPHIDATVKSALENGSVSEVVVRKDLLLFPVNAPNLVIAHRQEVHAVPQSNGTNSTDGKPTSAQVAEVNEYSLSQLVNDTDSHDETTNQNIATQALPENPQNDPVLEPGKLLEIASGFNLSHGLATEKVAIPAQVQNFSLPKQSIVDLLSKSLAKSDAALTTAPTPAQRIFKRSIDSKESEQDDTDSTTEEDASSTTDDDDSNTSADSKRSIDSEEDDKDSSSEESSDTTTDDSSSSTSSLKRSIDAQEYDLDSVDSTTMGSTSSTTQGSMENLKRSIDSQQESTSMRSADSTFSQDNGTENSEGMVKRSLYQPDDDMIGGISSSPESNNTPSSTKNNSTVSSTGIIKRSIEPEELEMSNLYNSSTSTGANDSTTDKIVKRYVDSDEDDDSSSSNTEYYDDEMSSNLNSNSTSTKRSDSRCSELSPDFQVKNSTKKLIDSKTISSPIVKHHDPSIGDEFVKGISNYKNELRDDTDEDMDVAEDIVFRPLFRYRQETQLKQQYNSARRQSNYRKPAFNSYNYRNQYRYRTDNSDYD